MTDNTRLNLGTGGDLAAADDIGGVKYQRVKLVLGDDNVNDGDVSKNNGMPVVPLYHTDVTTALLTAGNTYISPWFDTNNGNGVAILCVTDVFGTHILEESPDMVIIAQTDHEEHTDVDSTFLDNHILHARYFRLKWVNGAQNQSIFVHSIRQTSIAGNVPDVISVGSNVADDFSTSPLGIGAVFTSKWFDSAEGAGWTFMIFSEANGFYNVDQSNDKINVYTIDNGSYIGGAAQAETQVSSSRYFRFRFVNGAVAQTTFDCFIRQHTNFTGAPDAVKINPNENSVSQAGNWFTGPLTTALSTQTSVAAVAASTLILAANAARLAGSVYNDCDKPLYLLLSNRAASTSVFTAVLYPNEFYEFPPAYAGAVFGIWAAAPTGFARVMEY